MIPVYLINGFLESGKTEFIKYTLAQPYFRTKGTTLLVLCEEGELEYEQELLKKTKTVMEVIEDEEDFTIEQLMELEKKHKPERIIIEFNGMWNMKDMKLPIHWSIDQQITMIDASTFPMYYTNMKSMVAEMVRKSEMIIFNRCDGIKELSNYKRNVKAVNQQAEIIFEDSQGEIEEMMEEELPYDLNKPVIELDNEGYGIWYLDS
ncbi:MAG: GTPase, partial [Lachnospiraceae bacterium]|nr:GTPase [Lachnospiraceae bacterium]